jgi:hypothetical protein
MDHEGTTVMTLTRLALLSFLLSSATLLLGII